jgi:hypothetical protein
MKKQIKTVAMAVVMMALSTHLFAKNEREVNVSVENSRAVVFYMNNLKGETGITFKNNEGNSLLTEHTKDGFYGKVLSLESLGQGRMFLEIENDEKLERITVEIGKSAASIINRETLVEKPIVQIKNNLVKVVFGGTGEKVDIAIMDADDNVYHKERYQDNSAFIKRYDLSRLEAGDYKFKFKIGDRYFYHTFILK